MKENRRDVARLSPGRNIVQGPIVRSGLGRQPRRWLVKPWLDAERRFFNMVITIALWKRIATGRQRLLQKFFADGARNV